MNSKQSRKKQRHGGGEPQGASGSNPGVEECEKTEPSPDVDTLHLHPGPKVIAR